MIGSGSTLTIVEPLAPEDRPKIDCERIKLVIRRGPMPYFVISFCCRQEL